MQRDKLTEVSWQVQSRDNRWSDEGSFTYIEGSTSIVEDLSQLNNAPFIAGPNPITTHLNIILNPKKTALPGAVEVVIYNLRGEFVTSIDVESSVNHLLWDGCNYYAQKVKSGVYFVSLCNHGQILHTNKVIVSY